MADLIRCWSPVRVGKVVGLITRHHGDWYRVTKALAHQLTQFETLAASLQVYVDDCGSWRICSRADLSQRIAQVGKACWREPTPGDGTRDPCKYALVIVNDDYRSAVPLHLGDCRERPALAASLHSSFNEVITLPG